MFGKDEFPGMFNYVQQVMIEELKDNEEAKAIIDHIGKYFKEITSGKRITLAQWMRKYINQHHDYKHDSLLSKRTMDDLMITLDEISKRKIKD